MLENCSELKNPCASASSTIIANGVFGVTSENRQMVSPSMTVFTIRIRRNP